MSEHLEEDIKPDVDCLTLLSTDSQFEDENKTNVGNLVTLTENECSADRGNDNAEKEETRQFERVNMIKIESENVNDKCPCIKTETEEYYKCKAEDDTVMKQEGGDDDDIFCKQETCVEDICVKKEPVVQQFDYTSSVDMNLEGLC